MYAIWGMGDRCLFSWCVLSCFLFPQRRCTGASTGQYADGISAPILSPFCLSPDPWRLFRGDLWQILQCELVALVAWVVMTHRWGYSSPAKPLPAKPPLVFILLALICLSIHQKREKFLSVFYVICTTSYLLISPTLMSNKWKLFPAFALITSRLGSDIIQM